MNSFIYFLPALTLQALISLTQTMRKMFLRQTRVTAWKQDMKLNYSI